MESEQSDEEPVDIWHRACLTGVMMKANQMQVRNHQLTAGNLPVAPLLPPYGTDLTASSEYLNTTLVTGNTNTQALHRLLQETRVIIVKSEECDAFANLL